MDLVTIIGFIGSIVTLEEAGRNWIPMIKNLKEESACPVSFEIDNELVQYAIDKFESDVYTEQENHLFDENEIDAIVNGFLDKVKDIRLSPEDKVLVEDIIRKILAAYNDDTLSKMTTGEITIMKIVEKTNSSISTIGKDVRQLVHHSKKQEQYSCWINNDEIWRRGEKPVKEIHIKNYLFGNRYNCNIWGLIFQYKTVQRDIVIILLDKVITGGVFALTGPGGEGKTTVLMQLCMQLIIKGVPVLFYHGHQKPFVPENIPENTVFIFDNPSDTKGFKDFLYNIIELNYTLVIGSRDNEWNLLKNSLSIPDSSICTIHLSTLSIREAEDFAECVYSNLYLNKSRDKIRELFLYNSYGFLYAAMLLAVSDKNSLEEIAHQIINTLSKRSKKGLMILAHIVACEKYRILFTHSMFKDMCARLSISMREANYAISKEIIHNGNNYQTRHSIISQLFYKELFSDYGILLQKETDDVIIDLMDYFLIRMRCMSGKMLRDTQHCIFMLCRGVSTTSHEAQHFIIERLLDEKINKQELFLIKVAVFLDHPLRPILYRRCFEREIYIPEFFQKWCYYLIESGARWGVLEPFYPTWLYRKVCLETDTISSRIWKDWGLFEKKFRGAGNYENENSARWIYREACIIRNIDKDGIIWKDWVSLEMEETGPGSYDVENTARWIYKEACKKRNIDNDGILWRNWASLEEFYDIGDYRIENTARWIYREACKNRNVDKDGKLWEAWANLEQKATGLGDYNLENTARWIYREACVKKKLGRKGRIWYRWAMLEKDNGNIGNPSKENSSLWIFTQGMRNFPLAVYKDYSMFLLNINYIESTKKILRAQVEIDKKAYIYLMLFETIRNNTDNDDQFNAVRIRQQLDKIRRRHESADFDRAFYYYYCLENDVVKAKREWANIRNYYREDPRSSSIEEFIMSAIRAFRSKRKFIIYKPINEDLYYPSESRSGS